MRYLKVTMASKKNKKKKQLSSLKYLHSKTINLKSIFIILGLIVIAIIGIYMEPHGLTPMAPITLS